MNKSFTATERLRYSRHFSLDAVGEAGQHRLRQARVLVVGAGGLGSPALLYLAAAGVGKLGIVDPDRVSTSNLQRQVLYGEAQLGQLKVEVAKTRLLNLNPLIQIQTYPIPLLTENALDIISNYELVIDATDNFPTRYLINDACVLLDKIAIYGSVYRFEGQLSVFNAPLPSQGRGPNYRDLYPIPPDPGQVPSCAEDGILGILPGIIGTRQANEALKIILGIGEIMAGKLLLFDALSGRERIVRFPARADTRITKLIDYEAFCGLPAQESLPGIDALALRQILAKESAVNLLDVRTPKEYAAGAITGAQLFPLDLLEKQVPELSRAATIIVYCQSGKRARRAVSLLQQYGFTSVLNLEGGMESFLNSQ